MTCISWHFRRHPPLATLALCALLGACSTPPASKRSAESEQCYRQGVMRTCTTAPPSTAGQIAAVHRLSPPPMDRARLLIVRNDWTDASGHATLRLDGKLLQETIPCSVLGVDVRPGQHRLQIDPAGSSTPASIQIGAGELQVWRAQRTREGARRRGFLLTPLDAGDARSLVQECRVLGLIDRSAP